MTDEDDDIGVENNHNKRKNEEDEDIGDENNHNKRKNEEDEDEDDDVSNANAHDINFNIALNAANKNNVQ